MMDCENNKVVEEDYRAVEKEKEDGESSKKQKREDAMNEQEEGSWGIAV
jgi:hypothetical protein